MKNVIEFPTKKRKDRVLIEKTIKELLETATDDPQIISELSESLLSIWEKYQLQYSFNFSIPSHRTFTQDDIEEITSSVKEEIGRFENSLHNHMNTILLDRFQVEIKLYFAQRGE